MSGLPRLKVDFAKKMDRLYPTQANLELALQLLDLNLLLIIADISWAALLLSSWWR